MLSGKVYLSPQMTERLLHSAARGVTDLLSNPVKSLSDRELEVFSLIGEGLSTRQIARRLGVSPRTAEHHLQDGYTKIGVSTRASAAMFAMRHPVLAPSP